MPNKLSYTHSRCVDLCRFLRLWKLGLRIRKKNRTKDIVKSNAEQRGQTDEQIWKDWTHIVHSNCLRREEVSLLWFIPKKCRCWFPELRIWSHRLSFGWPRNCVSFTLFVYDFIRPTLTCRSLNWSLAHCCVPFKCSRNDKVEKESFTPHIRLICIDDLESVFNKLKWTAT